MMTVEEVRARIEALEVVKHDDEAAHGAEDRLYQDIVRAIANGTCVDAVSCCEEALRSVAIPFGRWCA